jgi:hypothetical protein
MPFPESGTSVQPVNRFSLFQVLSPWRSNTSFFMSNAPLSDGQRSHMLLRFLNG